MNLIACLEKNNPESILRAIKSVGEFKTPLGQVKMLDVMKIPTRDRIISLTKTHGRPKIRSLIANAVGLFTLGINVQNGLNKTQIAILSDMLIDEAAEDNLSIQDLILFLERMLKGEAGTYYNVLDIPTFMKLFDIYREERFQAIKLYRDEQAAQFKALGDRTERSSNEHSEEINSIRKAILKYNIDGTT